MEKNDTKFLYSSMKYKYKCCEIKEVDYPIGKAKAPVCSCGKVMERVIIHPHIHFRGEGFTLDKTMKD